MSQTEQPLIRNCRFAFRCHQRWQALEHTSDPRVRYCHECSQPVVLCRTDDELRSSLEADECVAIEVERESRRTILLGVVRP